MKNRPVLPLPHPRTLYFPSLLPLDPTAAQPLYQQLYDALQKAILAGRLAPGQRLPSSRELARLLDVSRNTVVNAVDQLVAEGYLETRLKSGTFVSRQLPDALLKVASRPDTPLEAGKVGARLSQRGRRWGQINSTVWRPSFTHHAFAHGLPAVDHFPFKRWTRLVSRHYRRSPELLSDYQARAVAGYRPLRQALADYLRTARAVNCHPEQIMIVAGSQQGLYLAAQMVLDPGDRVWIEDPGYLGARAAFLSAGAHLMPVPVGPEGLDVAAGRRLAPRARCAYLTPSHQFPLGATMSIANRLRLLEWAEEANAWLIEDDYDSEYRYSGQPAPSLQGLDRRGRVLYIGTFSKVMFPTIRLGYLVVPPALVDAFAAARRLLDVQSPLITQAALADFIVDGHFARHIRRMRTLYAERQALLVKLVEERLSGRLQIDRPPAGMHLVGRLPAGSSDEAVFDAAVRRQIEVTPLSRYYLDDCPHPGLVLGFTAVAPDDMRHGLDRLAAAVADVLPAATFSSPVRK